jgi:hypothetical protein
MDEVIELLDRTAKRIQKNLDESKEIANKKAIVYDQILQSQQTSQDQKTRAFLGKTLDLDNLEHLSSQMSLLYILQIFAFKVKVLEVSVDKVNDQMVKSGVLQKSAELDDIKKNIDSIKILMEAQFEAAKSLRESQNKTLDYVH